MGGTWRDWNGALHSNASRVPSPHCDLGVPLVAGWLQGSVEAKQVLARLGLPAEQLQMTLGGYCYVSMFDD